MRRLNTDREKPGDKNTRRIDRQAAIEEKVRKGPANKSNSSVRSEIKTGASENRSHFQTGGPGHAMFAVDPETERAAAAQGVPQNLPQGEGNGASGKGNISPEADAEQDKKRRKSAGSRAGSDALPEQSSRKRTAQPGHPKKKATAGARHTGIEDTGAWDEKGEPGFAAPSPFTKHPSGNKKTN